MYIVDGQLLCVRQNQTEMEANQKYTLSIGIYYARVREKDCRDHQEKKNCPHPLP